MTDKTKTLLITAPYFPPDGGGLERYAYEIASRLHRDFNWKIVVVTSGKRYGKDIKEEMGGLIIYRLSYRFKLSNTPLSIGWIRKIHSILKTENPEMINIHMPVPGIGDITTLFAHKKPVIINYHANSMNKARLIPDVFIWLYEHGPLHLLLRRANHIICSSDFVRFNFLGRYTHKSTTITPAVDINIFKPDPAKRAKEPTILFVAGLGKAEQHKGLQTLIEAVKKIEESIPNVKLNVVGDGDMRGEYERRVKKLRLEKAVTFTGRLSGEKLAEQYQRAHVFAFPSTNESFSMVILEAMASGLPVVATNTGGIPLLVRNNQDGLIIPLTNAHLFAKAIKKIIIKKDLASIFKENSLKKVSDQFIWDKKVFETRAIFRQIQLNQEKISVLIICKEYPPHVVGGLGVHYFELVQELKKYCTINLICAQEKEDAKKEEHFDDLHIYRIKIPPIFPLNHIVFNIFSFIQSFKIKKDIIHICSPFGILNILIRQSPIIVKIHTVYAMQKGTRLYNNLYFPIASFIDKFIISRSNHVITTSNFMKKDICEKYGVEPRKISVVHNGISKEFFNNYVYNKDSLKEKMNISKKTKVVLYVGRFVQRKGALNLIQAAPSVIKEMPNILFILIGGGFTEGSAYENSIHSSISRLGLENNVLILPWMPHEQVLEYYEVADVFIHPATYEPFGNNIVEAMAQGLPVISSKSGGPEEIIKDNGIILENNEPSLISKSIIDLFADDKRQKQLSFLSKKRAAEFSWDSTAKETLNIYHAVIKS